ncbi:hypothetical protein TEA_024017 [Camellia sinensis var. sinensis]|uniref:7,8-dihydroneopterin aldolase n=1 Tax=Camellia sinensis var. sinensis TaxID=542762 RepID=A0A4S4EEV0_CAMSN|nr:hypothetical protein TEA_024017 [Camellia sinensis var. sinensis]
MYRRIWRILPQVLSTERSIHQFAEGYSQVDMNLEYVWMMGILRENRNVIPGAVDTGVVLNGDKLVLRGLKFHGFHGVKPEERKLGQKFLVDVDAWTDLQEAGKSDLLSDTISYTEIYRIVREVVEGPPQNLLESLAQLIASTTLTKYPQISAVRIKVGKPHVAVHGLFKDMKVYVYDLPSKYNSLFASEVAIHRALVNSDVRTLDPWEADFFFGPVYVSCNFSTINGFPVIGHARSLISSVVQLIFSELPLLLPSSSPEERERKKERKKRKKQKIPQNDVVLGGYSVVRQKKGTEDPDSPQTNPLED